MLHYVSLLRESIIGGPESWIVSDCIKQHKDPNLIPDLAGLQREIQHDNLDFARIVTYLQEYEWVSVQQLSRPVNTEEGISIKAVTSSGIVAWTIVEFLQAQGGAITGIFFDVDGTFKRMQKYFYDRTAWQYAK